MTSMQAATGLVQLRQAGRVPRGAPAQRRVPGRAAGRDRRRSTRRSWRSTPYTRYYKYIGRLRPETGIDIARFVQAVAAEGVPISRRYPTPLPQQPVFRGLAAIACPAAERLAGELFTLLVHPTVTTADLDDVVAAIRKVVAGSGGRRSD